ncbi:MAG: CheR family methyltransferase [Geminicoccaceae bacterium]
MKPTDRLAAADAPLGSETPRWVVGVGAGAGGLEAIQLLFGAMPLDMDLAFVICRRLGSSLSDPLADLLCTQTSMPVVQAENGTRIEAGRIYLVASDARMILLKDRLVHFTDDAENTGADDHIDQAVSPIDILLHSLAASAGPAAIAIMLSGNDEDGVRGCASVRDHGGIVLVQHPESTEFSEMPRSVIEADLASAVAPPGALPDLIWRHIGKTGLPDRKRPKRSRDDDALASITTLLEARFAMDPHAYRPSLVAKRVRRRLAMSEAETLTDYATLLAEDDRELAALQDDLLIRVTTFFRNPEAFAALEREVTPILVERMSEERPIRVWVPACASGEEAYSLGILLLHQIERAGKKPYLEILASDRYAPALKQARAGRYRRDRIENVRPDLAARYLQNHADRIEVGPLLRRHVTFIDHDMLQAPPPDDIDLVSCRNLMIYLAAASREKAFVACCDALRPDGFLFLGPSEQPGPQFTDLETVHGKWRIYRRTPPQPSEQASSSPLDDTLAKMSEIQRRTPAETLPPAGEAKPEPGQPAANGKTAAARKNAADAPEATVKATKGSIPDLVPASYLEGVMAENQRMLESTIDTLLASNDSLRRRNRDLRAENQKLTHAHAALDDVATMIAHDLKAPLRIIDRMAGRLKTALAEDAPHEHAVRCLQPMQHQLIALNRLIDDLLIYARQGPVDSAGLRDVDLGDLLRETLSLIGLPEGVQVMMRPQSLQVTTWRIPLACIFRNLLGQAIERIGGAAGSIQIEVQAADRFLEVLIADDGQHAANRTGELGLAIVRQLLDAAGGRYASNSAKTGSGHHISFTWPIDGAVATEAALEASGPT